jgi:small conductance mechanosensitive channel
MVEELIDVLLSRKVVVPLLIILFSILIYLFISKITNKLLSIRLNGVRINQRRQKTTIGLINNIIKYFIMIVALMMILDVYGIDTKSLIASLGVLSLVVGLALQDLLKDFIAGFSIIFEDQYAVGDIVTIGGFKGTVTYLGIKTTRLRAMNGETLIIPNRNVDKVINHTLEHSTSFMDMPIAYSTDIDKAKEVLTNVCNELVKELKLDEAKVCGVQELGNSSIAVRISFTAKFADKITNEQIFRERVKKAFDENKIEIPFNQVVIHNGK